MPLLVSFTFRREQDGALSTIMNFSPGRCAEMMSGLGIDALGVNCGNDIGLAEMLDILDQYRAASDVPLFARPNAGTPLRHGKDWHYPVTSEAMAGWLPEILARGVVMIGGCCGTTPVHIAALRQEIDAWNRR